LSSNGLYASKKGYNKNPFPFKPGGKMTVTIHYREKRFEVKSGMTLKDSLKKINILPESILAVRNGEMVLEDEILENGQEVKLISVISGG